MNNSGRTLQAKRPEYSKQQRRGTQWNLWATSNYSISGVHLALDFMVAGTNKPKSGKMHYATLEGLNCILNCSQGLQTQIHRTIAGQITKIRGEGKRQSGWEHKAQWAQGAAHCCLLGVQTQCQRFSSFSLKLRIKIYCDFLNVSNFISQAMLCCAVKTKRPPMLNGITSFLIPTKSNMGRTSPFLFVLLSTESHGLPGHWSKRGGSTLLLNNPGSRRSLAGMSYLPSI